MLLAALRQLPTQRTCPTELQSPLVGIMHWHTMALHARHTFCHSRPEETCEATHVATSAVACEAVVVDLSKAEAATKQHRMPKSTRRALRDLTRVVA